ncbi:hypothetical protein AMK59_383, partial [Oryctes borbonicus]
NNINMLLLCILFIRLSNRMFPLRPFSLHFTGPSTMLQQILRDLYVDPEILAELDEQQKQNLFCRMREEQVRRWKAWTERIGRDPPRLTRTNPNKNNRTVSFLKGIDGEPWVWVMGEHENDKSIDEILRDEAIEKARKMAEKEAEELRKQVEAKITMELIELTPKIEDLDEMTPKLSIEDDDTGIYCSVDELREKMSKPIKNINNYSICHYQSNKNKLNNIMDREVLQELSINKNKVAQRVALWEKRLTEERTCEIFKRMQKKQLEAAKEAEEAEQKQEQLWIEQEKKAKQAEKEIREIARRAREEHRLSSSKLEIDTSYCNVTPGVPPGRQAVIDWFRTKEVPRNAVMDPTKRIEPWFHGLITRRDAESLLMDQPDGSFLVRLSEKIWGYAISYRAKEKCKHYLVNATQNYCFLGSNQIEHKCLSDLIAHHRQFPLSGGEKLQNACPRKEELAIAELSLK